MKIKRLFDIIISLFGIIMLFPLFFFISILVRLFLGSPVLYLQQRIGINGRFFKIYKFRSMTQACDEQGNLLPDSDRLTAFGKVLRRTKIDELPQLFNVLIGDMSLVGPRPTIMETYDKFNDFQKRRMLLRPGMTGLAQVNGNISVSWEDRTFMDVYYIDHWSLWLDAAILVKTIYVIIVGEKIDSEFLEKAKKYAVSYCGSGR